MADKITYRRLGPDDLNLVLTVPDDIFDYPVDRKQTEAFLADPNHEIVFALMGERVVGFASGTLLLHPDKAPGLFINEVGVAEPYRRRGIGKALTQLLIEIGRERGCDGAWLGTETDNAPALALYRALDGDEVQGVYFGWDGALDPV